MDAPRKPHSRDGNGARNALFLPHIGFCLGRTVIAEPK
jgi:hypothetical protein